MFLKDFHHSKLCSSGHIRSQFLFIPYYFSNNPPHEWKLLKHNANDDADTEKVEEKLLYRE